MFFLVHTHACGRLVHIVFVVAAVTPGLECAQEECVTPLARLLTPYKTTLDVNEDRDTFVCANDSGIFNLGCATATSIGSKHPGPSFIRESLGKASTQYGVSVLLPLGLHPHNVREPAPASVAVSYSMTLLCIELCNV